LLSALGLAAVDDGSLTAVGGGDAVLVVGAVTVTVEAPVLVVSVPAEHAVNPMTVANAISVVFIAVMSRAPPASTDDGGISGTPRAVGVNYWR
jgi:hypothetical protein